jgi:hypothetical protein
MEDFDHFLGARGRGDENSAVVMVEDPPPSVLLGLPTGERSLSKGFPCEAKRHRSLEDTWR